MKIKIIKSGMDSYWYANQIGNVYDASKFTYDKYKVDVLINNRVSYVDISDVEVLNETIVSEVGKCDSSHDDYVRLDGYNYCPQCGESIR